MKKTIIGSVFMMVGVIIDISILITAALYIPNINTWRGLKIWFAIFGAKDMGNTAQSLYLGMPFVVGFIFFILGFVILAVEYFKKDRD